MGASVVHRALSPSLSASAPTDGEWLGHLLAFQLPGLFALVAIAVVVWRRDILLAVPAATVVAIQSAMSLTERLAPPTRSAGPYSEAALPEVVGVPLDAAVHAIAAAIVVAAVAGLILAARTEWHARTSGSVHAASFPR